MHIFRGRVAAQQVEMSVAGICCCMFSKGPFLAGGQLGGNLRGMKSMLVAWQFMELHVGQV